MRPLRLLGVGSNQGIPNSNRVVDLPSPSIPIFIVLGEVGVGKSSFIAAAQPKKRPKIGHSLVTGTESVEAYEVVLPRETSLEARRILLVDTPGLNDFTRPDAEILESIARWVGVMSQHGPIQIAGIIYLVPVPGFERAFVSGTFHNELLEFAPLIIVTASIHTDGRITDDYLRQVRKKFPGFYKGHHISGGVGPEIVWKVITDLLSSPTPPLRTSNIFREKRQFWNMKAYQGKRGESWFRHLSKLFRFF